MKTWKKFAHVNAKTLEASALLQKGNAAAIAGGTDLLGAIKMCVAVNPSDTAHSLVALNGKIKTNRRTLASEQFWDMAVPGSTVLDAGEIVTEIQVPAPAAGIKSTFIKFTIRKSIDFPIVNCAAAIGNGDARICLNAVYNKPYRASKGEQAIKGKAINEANAEAAGDVVVSEARSLPGERNKWKIQIAKVMVRRAILGCA
jgi:xanthine dehydrogenase YagS FAD-binding subunit